MKGLTMDDQQEELFKSREFDGIEQKKKFAACRLEQVTEYLEGQGIEPLFIAHALFDQYNKYNEKGLKRLSENK